MRFLPADATLVVDLDLSTGEVSSGVAAGPGECQTAAQVRQEGKYYSQMTSGGMYPWLEGARPMRLFRRAVANGVSALDRMGLLRSG